MRFNTLVVLFAAVILFAVGNAQVVSSVVSVITGAPSKVSSAIHRSSTTRPVSSVASSVMSSSATSSETASSTSGSSSSTGTPASSAAATTDVSQTVMLQFAGLLTIFAVSFGMMLA